MYYQDTCTALSDSVSVLVSVYAKNRGKEGPKSSIFSHGAVCDEVCVGATLAFSKYSLNYQKYINNMTVRESGS